jgi:hypothetical protein
VPYRASAPRSHGNQGDAVQAGHGDRELLLVYGVAWASAVARLVYVLAASEPFSGEAGLALCVALAIPWLLREPLCAMLGRLGRSRKT